MNLTEILGKVAPWLVAAAAGPAGLAGMAVKTIAETLGATEETVESITAAVAGATPEQVAALKAADQAFAVRMRELGFQRETDLARIDAGDRASARQREVDAKDTDTPRGLAAGVTLGFFGVLAYLLVNGKPDAGGDALLVMLGSLGTAWTAIIAYYFGSSAGSARKSELLANSTPTEH